MIQDNSQQFHWKRLLDQYRELYWHWTPLEEKQGNSSLENHRRVVLANIERARASFRDTLRPSVQKPVSDYLHDAFNAELGDSEKFNRDDEGKSTPARMVNLAANGARSVEDAVDEMLKCIFLVKKQLTWEHGYKDIPEELAEKFAYAEVLGPRGPILFEELILGLVLLGPDCFYPEHRHNGIAESYICLSGWCEINHTKLNKASCYYNAPDAIHYIKTGSKPCLLAYGWQADNPKDLNHYTMELD